MLVALVVLLVLGMAVVALVAWPLVRERTADLSPPDAQRLALLERRDAALQALQELDLDHQAGKLTDEDAANERHVLRDEAVAALAELEALGAPAPAEKAAGEQPADVSKPPA